MLQRPTLDPRLHFVFSAFRELSTDRPIGFAVGPIPFSAIDRYAARYGVADPDDFDRFRELIRAMDEVYLEHVRRPGEGEQRQDTPKWRHSSCSA